MSKTPKLPPGPHEGKITNVIVYGVYEGEHIFINKSEVGAVMIQYFTLTEYLCPHDRHRQRCPKCKDRWEKENTEVKDG